MDGVFCLYSAFSSSVFVHVFWKRTDTTGDRGDSVAVFKQDTKVGAILKDC